MNSKTHLLRQRLIEDPEPLIVPYGACALHAVLAHRFGHQAIALSGSWASAYLLGRPDVSLISFTEMANQVRYMVMATELPVIADCDQGFGNAVNTFHSVRTLINTGCAGLHIEDQPYPKRCGFVAGKEVISRQEMVGKLQAAQDAKMEADPAFVIIARIDSLTAVGGGFADTVNRAKAYREEGGADVIYIEGTHTLDEIQALRNAIEGPLFCSTFAIQPHPTFEQLRDLGQCAVQLVNLICEPASIGAWEVLEAVKENGLSAWQAFEDKTKGHPLSGLGFFDLVGMPDIKVMEQRYLPSHEMKKYDQSSGLYKLD